MNILEQNASVQCEHSCSHEHPSYRQIEFPEKANQWIQGHLKYNLRSSELYRYQDNQLLPSKTYLERPEIVAREFKILTYFDNNFVKALGFATPSFIELV